MSWEKYLKNIYTNPTSPVAYSSINKLYAYVQSKGRKISRKSIKKFLEKQESYTLNKESRKPKYRNRVNLVGLDQQWDMDLASISRYTKENDGVVYLLFAIDLFSRYLWIRTLKNKGHREVISAIKSIFQEGRKPASVRTDAGKDFSNQYVDAFFKKKKINHFVTHNQVQANFCERVIKTIKTKIYKHMIQKDSKRFVDSLQQFVKTYNRTKHSSLGRTPQSVNANNEDLVYLEQEAIARKKYKKQKKVKTLYKIGDKVRISLLNTKLAKNYDHKWSIELFEIVNIFKREGQPFYKLKDMKNNKVNGSFYQSEIQKANEDPRKKYKIQKIVKRRVVNGIPQVKVRWLGYNHLFDSWLNEKDITGN